MPSSSSSSSSSATRDDDSNNGGILWKGPNGADIYDYSLIAIRIEPWELMGKKRCGTGRLNATQELVETLELYAQCVANVHAEVVASAAAAATAQQQQRTTDSLSRERRIPPQNTSTDHLEDMDRDGTIER